MPGQRGANDRFEIRDAGAPTEQLGRETGIGDQYGRIAGPSCGFTARDGDAREGGSQAHFDHAHLGWLRRPPDACEIRCAIATFGDIHRRQPPGLVTCLALPARLAPADGVGARADGRDRVRFR